MFHHHQLPPEIWLEIFDWATYDSILEDAPHDDLPFRQAPMGRADDNLSVRVALSAVCHTWREWASRALYRDIRVKHGTEALRESLSRVSPYSPLSSKFGDMVERVVLSYAASVTGPYCLANSVEILQTCTQLRTLSRPPPTLFDRLSFDYDAPMLNLPTLQRLEWWHHNEAERTGGINSLACVLRHSPNLRYLFVGGVMGHSYVPMQLQQIELPVLQTLRLHIINGLLFSQIISRWSLPSLTTIVLDTPCVDHADSMTAIWNKYGHTLRRVEFGRHVRFLKMDHIAQCLRHCPNLEELDYYLFFTKEIDQVPVHEHLKTVSLNPHVNSILVAGTEVWHLIEKHLEALGSSNLRALGRIVLHGEARTLLSHPRFVALKDKLVNSGRRVELPDGTNVD